MARVSNARSGHIEQWVVPAARELLIQEACKDVPTKQLDEIAFIEMGQSPDGNSVNSDGAGTPFIGGPADLGIEFPASSRWTTTPTKLCKPDDIIVCVRATIGEPRWSDGIYCLGRGVAGVRPKDGKIDRKFLFRIIQANERLLFEKGTGTTFKTITKDHLSQIEVPILSPETQKMIGEYLEWLESYSKTRPDFSTAPKLPDFLNSASATVAHIESLAARLNEAQRLREEASQEVDALIDSILGHLIEGNNPNWSYGIIPEFAEVNPSRKGQITLKAEDLVSFVPMKAVDDITGTITKPEPRPYQEVGKGYTWFQDGDVIFARITPCMENGKSAIAKNLVNGTGFGSTEFHVLRPSEKVLAEWLYVLVRSKQFKKDAADHFKGTAGQQRVPQSFLDNKVIPAPPLDEQRRIVAYLDGLQAKVNALRGLQSASGEELSALMSSVLDRAFKGEI